jgi:glycosyltransferase involved in cell wall biosynthesis
LKATTTGDLVSIIIVTFNSLDWLKGCLESIQVQQYQPLEIIVIDNGSSMSPEKWLIEHYLRSSSRVSIERKGLRLLSTEVLSAPWGLLPDLKP